MTFYDVSFTTKSLILTPLIMQVLTKLIFGYLWKRKTHILIMKSWRMQFMKMVHIQQVQGLLLILNVSLYVNNLITYSNFSFIFFSNLCKHYNDFSFYFVQTCVQNLQMIAVRLKELIWEHLDNLLALLLDFQGMMISMITIMTLMIYDHNNSV